MIHKERSRNNGINTQQSQDISHFIIHSSIYLDFQIRVSILYLYDAFEIFFLKATSTDPWGGTHQHDIIIPLIRINDRYRRT